MLVYEGSLELHEGVVWCGMKQPILPECVKDHLGENHPPTVGVCCSHLPPLDRTGLFIRFVKQWIRYSRLRMRIKLHGVCV